MPGAPLPGAPGTVLVETPLPVVSCVRMPLRPFVFLLALVALLPGRGMVSGTEVRVDRGRVIVQASGVPLTDVLSRFSQATGAKVVYDAAKPRQLVTVEIDASSQAEALSQLLEGQGLSYAVRLDPSGQSVDMLFVMGKGQPATASSSPAPAVDRRQIDRRQSYDAVEEPPVEADAALEEAQDPTEVVPDPLLDPTTAAGAGRGAGARAAGPDRRTEQPPLRRSVADLSSVLPPGGFLPRLPVALLHEVADNVHDHVRRARGLRAAHRELAGPVQGVDAVVPAHLVRRVVQRGHGRERCPRRVDAEVPGGGGSDDRHVHEDRGGVRRDAAATRDLERPVRSRRERGTAERPRWVAGVDEPAGRERVVRAGGRSVSVALLLPGIGSSRPSPRSMVAVLTMLPVAVGETLALAVTSPSPPRGGSRWSRCCRNRSRPHTRSRRSRSTSRRRRRGSGGTCPPPVSRAR